MELRLARRCVSQEIWRKILPRIGLVQLSYDLMKRRPTNQRRVQPLTDNELDRALRSVKLPTRPKEYWQQFTKRVITALRKIGLSEP